MLRQLIRREGDAGRLDRSVPVGIGALTVTATLETDADDAAEFRASPRGVSDSGR